MATAINGSNDVVQFQSTVLREMGYITTAKLMQCFADKPRLPSHSLTDSTLIEVAKETRVCCGLAFTEVSAYKHRRTSMPHQLKLHSTEDQFDNCRGGWRVEGGLAFTEVPALHNEPPHNPVDGTVLVVEWFHGGCPLSHLPCTANMHRQTHIRTYV